MIEIIGITKIYCQRDKRVLANENINLQIKKGEIIALLGPNGAGKTTLVKQIVGILKPTSGHILLDGRDLILNRETLKSRIAYVPQVPWILGDLPMYNALYIIARLNHKNHKESKQAVENFLYKFNLSGKKERPISSLSGGEARILNFGYATMGSADYFFLDEPTNDLSPGMRKILWDYIFSIKECGKSVFLVTHNLLDIQQRVDRVLFMNKGKIILDDRPETIINNLGKELTIYVRYRIPLDVLTRQELIHEIRQVCSVPVYFINSSEVKLITESEQLNILLKLLYEKKDIENMYIYPPTLEDIYHKIIVE
ncbi:MAG: ABC transporter ATP-binding protein [candidate division WOR-3 bacterium]